MANHRKDNDDIRNAFDAFRAAFVRAREAFAGRQNVLGVGFGLKYTDGRFTDDMAIVVFVRVKKPLGEIPHEDRIPIRYEGYLTDVFVPPDVTPGGCTNSKQYDIIRGGIQISCAAELTPSGPSFGPGTLGSIVYKRGEV